MKAMMLLLIVEVGEGSTCALLADEVQRLHAVVDVLEKKQ